jgi:hypothetical protein
VALSTPHADQQSNDEIPKTSARPNQLSKPVVDVATGEERESAPLAVNEMTVQGIPRLGGPKGGKARAKNLSKAERVKMAEAVARARCKKQA